MKSLPLKWHGGKQYLAKWIIEHFPEHIHYVEPYFGGGAVLFAKQDRWRELQVDGHSEVVNDINGHLVAFWRVLADDELYERFMRQVSGIPVCEYAFQDALEILSRGSLSMFHVGLATFIRYRQSRQGLGRVFGTLSRTRTRRGMNEQASSWWSAVEGLPEAHERLKRVVIFNRDALDVIRQQDGPDTFFYLDPPYLHETRVTTGDYEHEMTEEQHKELLSLLMNIKGKFLLSGYRSKWYDDVATKMGWHRSEQVIDCKASSKKVKENRRECLWRNYEVGK